MPHLLHLDSSISGAGSKSRELTAAFADAWRARGAGHTVTHRDLAADPLPHLLDDELHWPEHLRAPGAHPPADVAAVQQAVIAELLTADVLLVGSPLYNYSLPSTLKVWVDHVHVPGVTTPFGDDTQPLAGRPAVVVSTAGAIYDVGSPTADWDHGVPVLDIVLGTAFGMRVTVVKATRTLAGRLEGMAPERTRADEEFAAARARLEELGATLG
ncbi:FMN-dependent NADH-azoreductase [Kineococcus sp. R8]|uniref:FMN-dependent NADH-azoreductase n=1 Tax=Kineococcus siccus TaxID=2696567 RepID=UPI001411FAC4|nr:NAD(P)H-dependent oxidoreductase [Kineococcus siccus]NAZ81456.1 FMN-dependent NADH-azoreductase [Kineococcus siccus]